MRNLDVIEPDVDNKNVDTSGEDLSESIELNAIVADKGTPPQGPTPRVASTIEETA